MATLDPLEEKSFQPLDINTPIVDRAGMPTPAFKQNQRSFRRVMIAESKATKAAIIQEGEARAESDYANALLVDRVTAEALGFTAAVMMKMEVGINPAGVLARYQIMASLDPGGTLVQTGLMFDIVSNGTGGYLGQIILDADKVKIGRANTTGAFPFYLDGNVLYIESAVIKNLSVGTDKLSYNAATSIVITSPGGRYGNGSFLQTATIYNEYGSVSIDVSGFLDRPGSGSGNFGYLQVSIWRGSTVITTRNMFYDDNFAYPIAFTHVDSPPPGQSYSYRVKTDSLSGDGNYEMFDTVIRLINFKR